MGAIDERLGQIEFAAIAKIFGESAKHPLQRSVFNPRLKSSVTGLIRRVSAGQVCPWRTGPKDPHHAVDDVTWIPPRASTFGTGSLPLLARKGAFDRVPLLVGEVHPQP